jgi:hypothetical protein
METAQNSSSFYISISHTSKTADATVPSESQKLAQKFHSTSSYILENGLMNKQQNSAKNNCEENNSLEFTKSKLMNL